MSSHRYRLNGPTDSYLEQFLGVGAVIGGPVAPSAYALRELDSESLLTDLDFEMARAGFVRDDSSLELPISTLQVKRAKLSSDAAGIAGASYATVLSVSLTTRGGTVLELRGSVVASVVLGGNTRIVIDGGAFSDQVVLSCSHPILSNAFGGGDTYISIPATENATSYDIRVECASVALGTLTPRAGSALIATEYTA